MLQYKKYKGIVTALDEKHGLLHGEVLGINDVVTFQGKNVDEFVQAFGDSIDDYLEFCDELKEEPEKPFSGKVLVRMPPSLHKQAELAARTGETNLNSWIVSVIQQHAGNSTSNGSAKSRQRKSKKVSKKA